MRVVVVEGIAAAPGAADTVQAARMRKLQHLFHRSMLALEATLPAASMAGGGALPPAAATRLRELDVAGLFSVWAALRAHEAAAGAPGAGARRRRAAGTGAPAGDAAHTGGAADQAAGLGAAALAGAAAAAGPEDDGGPQRKRARVGGDGGAEVAGGCATPEAR